MEPLQALSRFIYLTVLLSGPVAWALVVIFKSCMGRSYDGAVAASSEEIVAELKREFTPFRRTTIRTQTEYLPFVFECIRENIDSGFEDPQMISLLQRIEHQQPNEERSARFVVLAERQHCDLHLRWVRDSCDRILLHIQAAPTVIRALRNHQRRIPRAVT
jgi:hypothetical protein